MKLYELMIDNWVLINGIPRKIKQITKKKVGFHYTDNECTMKYAMIHDISQIELTNELLVANGWQYDDKDEYWWHDEVEFVIWTNGIEKYASWITSISLNSVNQLQNLLNISGNVQLAKNFKV